MHSPCNSHLEVTFRLLRFLKQNPRNGIKNDKIDSWELKGFVDADWAKCLISRRSVTGFVVYLGGSILSWKSKKQDTVSRSSTESEYRALGSIACEITWILKVLFDLKIKGLTHVNIFCDSESAIKLVLNPVFHEKTKHFEVDVHFIRDKVSKGILKVEKVRLAYGIIITWRLEVMCQDAVADSRGTNDVQRIMLKGCDSRMQELEHADPIYPWVLTRKYILLSKLFFQLLEIRTDHIDLAILSRVAVLIYVP
ncbi:hypothetical protein L1887_23522 [Cichorium endivia]|nr:hypothetical protein L1887_23522 [Cichorium endivia]